MNLKRATFLTGTLLLLCSMAFLAGWIAHRPLSIAFGSDVVATSPNSATGFALAGLTLLFLAGKFRRWRTLARTTTILLALLHLSRLLELSLRRDWGVDEFFISYSANLPPSTSTGTASVSAICFLLAALGFMLLLWRGRVWAGDVLACSLALVVGVVGLVFIGGYLVGAPVLFAFDTASMAFTTACLFVLLAAGLLCAGLTEDSPDTRDPFIRGPRIPIEKKLSVGAGAALGVVMLMGLLSYDNTVKFIQSSRWVEQTQRLLAVLESAQGNIVDAEAGERGFVLTGEETFLDPYEQALLQNERRLQQLWRLSAGNSAQQARVANVATLIRTRLRSLSRVVGLYRAGQRDEAVRLIASGEGRRLMDQIRLEAAVIKSLAQEQLLAQAAAREDSRMRTLFTFAAAGLVVALILLGVHLLLAHDLSGRRRAEAALRRHNDTLRSFAHSVAHDLRAPLRGIDGYARELAHDHGPVLDQRARFCLAQISTAATNLEQLIQDTLDYARLDTEALTLEPVDLPALVEKLLHERAPQIREHHTEVTTAFHSQRLQTWPRGVTQILANLLDNALKYSRHAQPPKVSIESAETPAAWLLTIRDNGIGFDMRHHDRIFGLFQRLVTPAEFEGTGAGLAIAKKITERLGGTLRAEAQLGVGATFHLSLPKSAPLASI